MTLTDWVTLVSAAAGALFGSLSAFALQLTWQRAEEKASRHGALMESQFAVSMQLNTVVNIRNQYLAKCRHDRERYMCLVPFIGSPDAPHVDFGSIGFLGAQDDAAVLQAVHVAQSAFLTVLTALDIRNALMTDSYAAATQVGPLDFETGEAQVSLDARKARILKGATDSLYAAVDTAVELGHDAMRELGRASKRLYPKLPVLTVEEVPEPVPESS